MRLVTGRQQVGTRQVQVDVKHHGCRAHTIAQIADCRPFGRIDSEAGFCNGGGDGNEQPTNDRVEYRKRCFILGQCVLRIDDAQLGAVLKWMAPVAQIVEDAAERLAINLMRW